MRIGLIGSSGYIAGYLRKSLSDHEVIKFDKTGDYDYQLDLADCNDFDFNLLNGLDYLVFTAAISSPDLCQKEYEMCWNINVEGTGKIIDEALKRNCRVIFFSSDAVYGNHPDEVFDENSKTETDLAYGMMKKAIEDRFASDEKFKAIRLSYVVSKNDKFVSYCLKCKDSKEILEVYDPFCRNCITVSDVTETVSWLIDNWNSYNHSFLNIAGKELISREDIVKALNVIFDNAIEYKVIYPGDEFYTSRPAVTQMKSLYLYEYGIIRDLTFIEKLKKEFEF